MDGISKGTLMPSRTSPLSVPCPEMFSSNSSSEACYLLPPDASTSQVLTSFLRAASTIPHHVDCQALTQSKERNYMFKLLLME